METNFFEYKTKIREIKIEKLKIGNENSISYIGENKNNSPKIAIEINFFEDEDFFKRYKKLIKKCLADLICIKINLEEENFENDFYVFSESFAKIFEICDLPIIFKGINNNEIDAKILKFVAKNAPKRVIIASANEYTYEEIVPEIVKNNHILTLKSPIDINLAKELNILSTDLGLASENILIDSDTGGLGYGLEYGYSMIEKIKQAGLNGDLMLNMPIISFVGEEIKKEKEVKSDNFPACWGERVQRATFFETIAACAMINAGANIVVLYNPISVNALRENL